MNDNPEEMFHRQMYRFDRDVQSARPPKPDNFRVVIPYYPVVTEHIRRIVTGILDVSTKPHTLADILLPATKIQAERHLLQAPVYCAFCASCGKRYYGETEGCVFPPATGPPSKEVACQNALAKHEVTYPEHRINPDILILFREQALQRRLLLEAMAGRAEQQERSINFEWEATLDEHPDPSIPLRRQGRLAPTLSSGSQCSACFISPIRLL